MLKRKFFFPFFLALFLLGVFLNPLNAAEKYDIKEMTPVIEQAIKGRQMRYQDLQELKTTGQIGEDNQGFVQSLKNSPEAGQLARSENEDRQTIYQAIVEQNHLGPQGMPKVKAAFAEVQRERSQKGEFVQLPTGAWVQKT